MVAKTPAEKTWQPTESGSFALFGVLGPEYAPDKYTRGYLVFDPDRIELFAKLYDENAQIGEQVRDDRSKSWKYRFYPEDKRGTWATDGVDVVLTFNGREVWRNRVVNNSVPQESRSRDFSPAGPAALEPPKPEVAASGKGGGA